MEIARIPSSVSVVAGTLPRSTPKDEALFPVIEAIVLERNRLTALDDIPGVLEIEAVLLPVARPLVLIVGAAHQTEVYAQIYILYSSAIKQGRANLFRLITTGCSTTKPSFRQGSRNPEARNGNGRNIIVLRYLDSRLHGNDVRNSGENKFALSNRDSVGCPVSLSRSG